MFLITNGYVFKGSWEAANNQVYSFPIKTTPIRNENAPRQPKKVLIRKKNTPILNKIHTDPQ